MDATKIQALPVEWHVCCSHVGGNLQPAHVIAQCTRISMTGQSCTQCVARLALDGMDSQPCHNDGYNAALTSDPWQFNGTAEGRVPWDHPWGFTALMEQQTWDLTRYQWSWMPCGTGTGMLVERRSQLTCLDGKRRDRERERGKRERQREGERA